MPTLIYRAENNEEIRSLSEDNWELPSQMLILEKWLEQESNTLSKDHYIADIGFEVRKDASGGGAVLSRKMIGLLQQIGMEIYFSEYNF